MKYNFFIALFITSIINCDAQFKHNSLVVKSTKAIGSNILLKNANGFENYGALNSFSDSVNSKAYYLERRNKLNKTGSFFLITGLTISVINQLFIPVKNGSTPSTEKNIFTGIGLGCILTSIPFFISSHHNKMKAINIGLKNEHVFLPSINTNFNQQHFVAFKMSVKF